MPRHRLPPDGFRFRYGPGEADAVRLDGRLGFREVGGLKVELVMALRSRPRRPRVELDQVPDPVPVPRLLLVTLPVGLGHPDLKKF